MGLLIATALAAVLAVAEGVLGVTNSVGGLLLAVVGAFAAVFGIIYGIAWLTAPAHLAWAEHTREESEGEDYESEFSVGTEPQTVYKDGRRKPEVLGPPVLRFPTKNRRNRFFPTNPFLGTNRVRILRVIDPVTATISRVDLPYTLRLPRRGQLVIKDFPKQGGILLDEIRTVGRNIRAEIYLEEDS